MYTNQRKLQYFRKEMSYLISLQNRALCYISVMMLYLKVASAFSFALWSHMQLSNLSPSKQSRLIVI